MSIDGPLHFVVLLGSLRRGSLNGALARALPALAPADVTVEPLGSIGGFPIYDGDVEAQGIPAPVVAMGEAIRKADGVVVVPAGFVFRRAGVNYVKTADGAEIVVQPGERRDDGIEILAGLADGDTLVAP